MNQQQQQQQRKKIGIQTQNTKHKRAKRVTNLRRRQKNRDPHTEQNTQNGGGSSPTAQVKPEAQHLAWHGRAPCAPCSQPKASHLRATAASLAECTQLQQHHTELAADRASELAADRARDRALADAQRQKEQNRVRECSRSVSIRQSAGGVGEERERESRVRRWQLAGDFGKERERESAAARRQRQSYRKEACRNLATIQKFQTLQGAANSSFSNKIPTVNGTSILRHHNTQARVESGTIGPSKRGGRRG